MDRDHYNQSIVLEWKREPIVYALENALEALVDAHDALRLRFVRGPEEWTQVVGDTPPGYELLSEEHVGPEGTLDQALEQAATRVQRSLDIESGRVLRATLFHFSDRPSLLLVVVHHLAVDTFSWRPIVEDLHVAYANLVAGGEARLAPDQLIWSHWASELSKMRVETGAEKTDAGGSRGISIPRALSGRTNTVEAMKLVETRLSAMSTRALLKETPRRYGTPVETLLITALTVALSQTLERSQVTFDIERHGRDSRVPGPDRTNAVGWFAGVHRLTLEPVLVDENDESSLARAVKQVKSVVFAGPPGRRECDIEVGPSNPGLLLFNYSGQEASKVSGEYFDSWAGSIGKERSMRQERSHDIELEIEVVEGRLTLQWFYSPNLHTGQSVADLAQRCFDVLELLISGQSSGGARIPSDFPLASLSQAELDRVVADVGEIDDLYDLTPLQTGMLLHSLMNGHYLGRHVIECAPGLDEHDVVEVWRELVRRHTALRSSVHWLGLAQPVQVVHPPDTAEVAVEDWCEELLESRPDVGERRDWRPAVTVARVGADRLRVIIESHHMWLDGWSVGVLTHEAGRLLEQRTNGGRRLPVPVPYRRYVEWLQERAKRPEGQEHWKALLQGSRPCLLDPEADGAGGEMQVLTVELPEVAQSHVHALATSLGVTPVVTLLASWAMVLSRASQTEDLVLGCVVDGRGSDLTGIDRIVGLVMNTVPIRWAAPGAATAATALPGLMAQLRAAVEHGHMSLSEVQRNATVRADELFDTLFVVEDATGPAKAEPFWRGPEGREEAHYALTLTVLTDAGHPVAMELSFRRDGLGARAAEALVAGVSQALTLMVAEPDRSLAEVAADLS